jgi:hypothetical protein
LNKVMNRNENLDECVRVRKLNEVIDDLRIENSLLKSQLNNLSDYSIIFKTSQIKSIS